MMCGIKRDSPALALVEPHPDAAGAQPAGDHALNGIRESPGKHLLVGHPAAAHYQEQVARPAS
jgi:hypothetical protein